MRALSLGAAIVLSLVALAVCTVVAPQSSTANRVRITVNEAERRIDILIDGNSFTSYIWPEKLAKPVLFPLRTAKGTIVTRGFPLEPRPGERIDHPHQAGLWL